MSLASDFRAFLLAQPAIADLVGDSVHVNSVPEHVEAPYIWLRRARIAHERSLDQAQGEQPHEEGWDLEAITDDPSEIDALADAVLGIDSARGAFGYGTIQGLFIESQADDYVPRGLYSDEGLDVAAFQVAIYGYVPAD